MKEDLDGGVNSYVAAACVCDALGQVGAHRNLSVTRTKDLGLEDGALLGGPVLPVGVEGAGVLHRPVVISPATAGHLDCLGLGAVAL
mgnify:CR=1 FL=1